MIATLVTIWALHTAALISPGANVLLISHLAASGPGARARQAAIGVAAGAAIWALSAVLGIQALFHTLPELRFAVQAAGGLFLLALAIRLWRGAAPSRSMSPPPLSRTSAFRLGLFTNLTNPKSALFYGSVFAAAFGDRPTGALVTMAVVVVVANSLAFHTLLAFLFSRERVRAAYARIRRGADRVAALLLGGIGVGLLLATLREARR